MDIDFDPFRMLVLKITLIDIRASSKNDKIIDDDMTPTKIFGGFGSDKFFGLIYEYCYGWRHPLSVWLPKYVKISNYTIHINCKEDEHNKFVIYFNKKNNEVAIRSAIYNKEVQYFKYYDEKTHPINYSRPFTSITDYSNYTNVSRIIFQYEIM
ncbi:hypothetical protein RF11_05617 [Thelohanellus kitauei]|uniref:Uncharacterized protein n=1 Tax=Thelohanellus kitauei TaxID=669202 RepID=A0A0C2I5W8_THEKT|nr:hypothetical protein RF11_05617 [Thelohanellus kitauei]